MLGSARGGGHDAGDDRDRARPQRPGPGALRPFASRGAGGQPAGPAGPRPPAHVRPLAGGHTGRLDGLRLELLFVLAPTGRYLPAFLFPPATQPWGVLDQELEQIAASPPAVVRAELDKVREGRPLPAVLGPL